MAGVRADPLPRRVDDRPDRARQAAALEEGAIVVTGEEARFLALAQKALESSQATFMSLAKETFEKHSQAAAGGVKEVLAPAQEQLAKLATSVEALDKARLQDKSAMNEQVRQIVDAVGSTNKTTQNLLTALRASPKMRGRWGEQTLRNVLELSGLAAHVDFQEQLSTTDGEGCQRGLAGSPTIVCVLIGAIADDAWSPHSW